MVEESREEETVGSRHPAVGVMPPEFDPEYVENVVRPFFAQHAAQGETPSLPMIELELSKDLAVDDYSWGLLYDSWRPTPEADGISVFIQGYEKRGQANARKKIYMSATSPDLYEPFYRPKVARFLEDLLEPSVAGQPFMRHYTESYFDLYWDLHLGVRGDDVPSEVHEIGQAFNKVIGFENPTLPEVYESYMRVRELRPFLIEWIDERVQDVIDGKIDRPEATFVHRWLANAGDGTNFRRKDITFECFHNFLAFSQWGNTIYNIVALLSRDGGDSQVKEWFERTMAEPESANGGEFSALDRFVMELFRVISPNPGSESTATPVRQFLPTGPELVLTSHAAASNASRHWDDPEAFNPDRYQAVATSDRNDAERSSQLGFARCPFDPAASMELADGRTGEMANSIYGTVYSRVEGRDQPVVDTAGYAPFGFGYRRCAGEQLTVQVFSDFLIEVWRRGLTFHHVDTDSPERLPAGPGLTISDDITFAVSEG